MKNGEIIVCGLTDYENECIREHKGECSWCEYNDSSFVGKELIKFCSIHGRLKEFRKDCKDWTLDMR